ncbi:MAG: GDP-L-fucose synthase [Candidatus Magnetoglobus multicellularis str. Araruama]|uniref:GDP-L-fucose synthase n=1 Tax=Candidatus Magnetoglobus multicellularis str. Araruama TaxID=890399 RepID=A0A1V1PAB2_9BACT|nr:MAG: GDP-L-fucose synthase [Candidatus Magnetoglobus multicellularis str. Araruama]
MKKSQKIYISGHKGMAGSAIHRELIKQGYTNIITRARNALDLMDKSAVLDFFQENQPDFVFNAAAKVGGILANNTYPADFIHQNLEIQNNVIYAAHKTGVKKLLFLGSSCIYPRECPQPMQEEHLLTGPLEPTNDAYAIAKIAGIIMCHSYYRQYGDNYLSIMPTNLYGPGDNFDLQSSHVLPALIRKFHAAKVQNKDTVTLWGSGIAKREFLHVDDMANAAIFIMQNIDASDIYERQILHLNVGTGKDISIENLAILIRDIIGFKGNILYDTEKPDGMLEKRLDVSRLNDLGWQHRISLSEGIRHTYDYYQEMIKKVK